MGITRRRLAKSMRDMTRNGSPAAALAWSIDSVQLGIALFLIATWLIARKYLPRNMQPRTWRNTLLKDLFTKRLLFHWDFTVRGHVLEIGLWSAYSFWPPNKAAGKSVSLPRVTVRVYIHVRAPPNGGSKPPNNTHSVKEWVPSSHSSSHTTKKTRPSTPRLKIHWSS